MNVNIKPTIDKEILILMFASICIFLMVNLPLAIAKIILPQGQASLFPTIIPWSFILMGAV